MVLYVRAYILVMKNNAERIRTKKIETILEWTKYILAGFVMAYAMLFTR